MFKKIYIFIIIMLMLLNFNFFSFADDEIENINVEDLNKVIETTVEASEEPKISSRYAIVLDRDSKSVIYGKNEKTKTKMASTTKIMTALIVIETTNLSDIVEVSKKAANTGGSRLKINTGNKITVRDLLYGLMLRSGNDAAVALAEYVGGSITGFANLMNKRANELGLINTRFETPHGLDSDAHYTTAYELAILTDFALKNKTFSSIVSTKSCNIVINGSSRAIENTNELLGNLSGVYGVKTGFTNGAGRCLITSIKRNDLDIICVVLGADTKKIRTTDSVKLIEYTFKDFEYVNVKEKIEEEFRNWKNINAGRINIEKGIRDSINVGLEKYNLEKYPVKKNTKDKIQIQIEADLDLKAPIKENTNIGKIIIKYDNSIIGQVRIVTKETIGRKSILDYILEIGSNYQSYLEKIL